MGCTQPFEHSRVQGSAIGSAARNTQAAHLRTGVLEVCEGDVAGLWGGSDLLDVRPGFGERLRQRNHLRAPSWIAAACVQFLDGCGAIVEGLEDVNELKVGGHGGAGYRKCGSSNTDVPGEGCMVHARGAAGTCRGDGHPWAARMACQGECASPKAPAYRPQG